MAPPFFCAVSLRGAEYFVRARASPDAAASTLHRRLVLASLSRAPSPPLASSSAPSPQPQDVAREEVARRECTAEPAAAAVDADEDGRPAAVRDKPGTAARRAVLERGRLRRRPRACAPHSPPCPAAPVLLASAPLRSYNNKRKNWRKTKLGI